VTSLGKFSPIVRLFPSAFFLLPKQPKILGCFFHGKKLCINFNKKWKMGYVATFWACFHKPIWPPSPEALVVGDPDKYLLLFGSFLCNQG
jgi:hypothetical protein